jgi:hypothetical protein
MQEVEVSQKFRPEVGLQVPQSSHLFSRMVDAETREVVRSRREAKFRSIFIFAEGLVGFRLFREA